MLGFKVKTPAIKLLQRLSKINMFRALPPEVIGNLKNCVKPVKFRKGEAIIREGAEGDSLFFIDKGSVQVSRRESGQIAQLSGWILRKADFEKVVGDSTELKHALEELTNRRAQGIAPELPSSRSWTATALMPGSYP